ncbi:MAG: siderophore ferric iron reductase [Rhizobiaceae bacterium]|nr:siderophore ferric iron reductase [Rhizobiaceae bacterium]
MGVALDRSQAETAFIDAVRTAMPGIDAALSATPSDWLGAGDDRNTIARLHGEIAAGHAPAGAAYHAVRSWSMLVWQPAMAGIMGVHGHNLALPVDRMGQRVTEGGVYGFRLPAGQSLRTDLAEMIELTATRIRAIADRLYAELCAIAPVKEKIAYRLLADRILGTLVHLHAHEPHLDVCAHAGRWLDAAGLSGMSALADVRLTSGALHPVLDRKQCCLHYLCEPGALCQSCPKQPRALRMERMQAYWSAHA